MSPSVHAVYHLVVGHLSPSRVQPWGPGISRVVPGASGAGRAPTWIGARPPPSHADTVTAGTRSSPFSP